MHVFQRYLAHGDKTYHGRFRFRGQDVWRNLGTETKAEAEKRLRDIKREMEAQRFAPVQAAMRRPDVATLGQVIAAFRVFASPRLAAATIRTYVNCLRCLVRAALGEGPLEARSTSVLTQDLVLQFQNKLLQAAGADRVAQNRARVNANSLYRQARAIFGKRARATYGALTLPDLTGFLHVPFLPESTQSYQPPPPEIVQAVSDACLALRDRDRNVYLAFLLAYGAGLRANEISHARHGWLGEENGRHVLRVGLTADFLPKGRDARLVPLDDFTAGELAALRTPVLDKKTPDFILAGGPNERTEEVWRRLSKVLVGAGLTTHKKAHELRKFYGSVVAARHGIFAAQKILGHKDPKVTSRFYAGLAELPAVEIFSAKKAA